MTEPDLPLERLIASLLVVRGSGHLLDGQRRYPQWELANAELQSLLELGVGGVILLGGSAAELALRCRQLQHWAAAPLLLCADVEEGVGQRFEGATWLPPPLCLGRLWTRDPDQALALAERYGRCTGREARAVGLNWVLGPVCDVNNNPANPVINVRAWGETPNAVAALSCAFSRGLQAEGVLGCAKHFPGHGDTSVDSHLELPVLPHSRERLWATELPPFAACIEAGIDAVMTAHLMLPALDPVRPATLSKAVLTDLLRGQMGFGGLVVTDALVMEAISRDYGAGEAAVLALEAGADLVLMPADAQAALTAISDAVASGRLSRARLEASAARRRRALQRIGAAPPAVAAAVDPDTALVQALLGPTLQRQGGQAAAAPGATGVNLIRLETCLNAAQAIPQLPAQELPLQQGYRTVLLEPRTLQPWGPDPDAPLNLALLGEGPVLLQLFVRGNPFRGASANREPWRAAVVQLQRLGRLAGLVVYGSPYLWQSLQEVLDSGIPAAYSPGQMPEAQTLTLTSLGFGDTGVGTEARDGFTD